MHAIEHAVASATNGTGQAPIDADMLHLDQIQGNLIGFNKPFQTFLFLRFPLDRQAEVRRWLRGVTAQVTTGQEVLNFRQRRRAVPSDDAPLTATWRNLAFTHAGLAALGTLSLDGFPQDFQRGMAARAEIIGDVDASAPEKWDFNNGGRQIHAIILLAADTPDDLEAEVARQEVVRQEAGIVLLHRQDGMDRSEQPGREHFGFKDGISQPDLRDGGFVIGYPHPDATVASELMSAGDDARRAPLPDWTRDGSFLVFRRLRQNVGGFRKFVRKLVRERGIGEDLVLAKLVGRYPSGAPLAAASTDVDGANTLPEAGVAMACVLGQDDDPGREHGDLLAARHINNFGYRDDPDGQLVPRGAHIRKVNPRDQADPGEREVRKRRILRRGIPFGNSYLEVNAGREPKNGPPFPHDRGLLFICYQSSIAEQFEFVQERWANNPNFPPVGHGGPPGHDPIIGQSAGPRTFDLPGSPHGPIDPLPRWVTMTGGDYFFSPSIDALCNLARERQKERIAVITEDMVHRAADAMPTPHTADVGGVRGSGSCSLTITAAVADLVGEGIGEIRDGVRRVKWRVLVGEKEVWRSNGYDDLRVNPQGIAAGNAQVSVRQLLRALVEEEEGLTVKEILDRTNTLNTAASPTPAANPYKRLRLLVELSPTKGIILPIDMGVGGNP